MMVFTADSTHRFSVGKPFALASQQTGMGWRSFFQIAAESMKLSGERRRSSRTAASVENVDVDGGLFRVVRDSLTTLE